MVVGQCGGMSWQLGWCVWQGCKLHEGSNCITVPPQRILTMRKLTFNTCHLRTMCVLQGLIRAQTMWWHHLAKWCAHFCKMGVLEAWHQIDTSVKQAEQASHSKQLFHVSDCAWCCHFRILSTPMDPFGASIATGVPGVRHVALH